VYPQLLKGAAALEGVVHAVRLLEDDALFNAGHGSKLQRDGRIRMSASLMDGARGRFSGCVNVKRVKNPIRLARALQNRRDRVLSCQGALSFAREVSLPLASPYTPAQREKFKRKKKGEMGTVGAVALDHLGRIAAGTSTGGRGFEYPFRVSDSPTVAGNYASRFCGISATGVGEEIVEFAVAAEISTAVRLGQSLSRASHDLLLSARERGARFGWIGLDHQGNLVAETSTPHLIWASAQGKGYEIHP
jgi:L-asparaginase